MTDPIHRLAAQPTPLQTAVEQQGGEHLHLSTEALHQRIHHPYGGAAGTQPPPTAADCHASASPSHLQHRHRQLTLEVFFLAHLPRFLHAWRSIFKPLTARQPQKTCLAMGLHLLCSLQDFLPVSRISSLENEILGVALHVENFTCSAMEIYFTTVSAVCASFELSCMSLDALE
jgi:hypothetical protein